MVRAIVVGHGKFAEVMVSTAEQIVGKQNHVEIISNTGLSCNMLNKKIAEAVDKDREQESLIFLDLPGGSCTISCYALLKENRELNIISGVNLPMLIEFFVLREKHSARELIPILIAKGKENIIQLRCRNE